MKNWMEVKRYQDTWKGENAGDCIEGVVESLSSVVDGFGNQVGVITIVNQGTKYNVYTNKVLQQKLEQANVKPGMEVRIEFLGKVPSKANPAWKYKNYKVYVASA